MIPQFSIIIPNLHSPVIGRVLAALQAQRSSLATCEVIVVGQDRYQIVQAAPGVTFVPTDQPVSAARARNLGIQRSTGEWLIFLDADCVPADDWGAQIVAHVQDPAVQVLVGAVDFPAADYWTLSDNVATFYGWTRGARPGLQPYAPTLNLIVRRGVVDRVGCLDERYPGAAGEDIDWTLRMRRAGYGLQFAPDVIISHQPQRNTLRQLLARAYGFGFTMTKVRLRYPDQIATPFYHRDPALVIALAPLMALVITVQIYVRNPHLLRYWYAAPAVYAAKVAARWGCAKRPLD